MTGEFYDEARRFVISSFKKNGKNKAILHFEETVKWIKVLRPNADEGLLIAGFSHDIEKAFSPSKMPLYKRGTSFIDKRILREHQEKGAEIMREFLQTKNAPSLILNKVPFLIGRHEEGGSTEADILKDADSLSYFETNAQEQVKWIEVGIKKEQIREKFDWMFNRISSSKAKELAKPMYEEACKLLEEFRPRVFEEI